MGYFFAAVLFYPKGLIKVELLIFQELERYTDSKWVLQLG